MENIEKEGNIKDSKVRSRLYPRYDMEEAINLIQVVSKLGRKNVSESSVAADVSKSVTNSGFIGRISSAKQFGLISKVGGKLTLTQLGNEIMFPSDDLTKAEAIKKAFTMPTLYKELIDGFIGTKIPEHTSLGNRLLDYGIEVKAKDVAAKVFIKSAEYAEVIQNGILIIENESDEQISRQESTDTISGIAYRNIGAKNIAIQTDNMVLEFFGGMKLVIPRNEKTSEALMDGELKEARKILSEFAEKFITKEELSNDNKSK